MGFYILLLLFIVVPVAEIMLLINIGGAIGPLRTILVVLFTAFLGAYLVRQQGFATLYKVQEEMNAGRVPAMQMGEGILLLFAGAVLLTPGFITDAVGFTLLVPVVRQAIIKWIAKKGFIQAQASTNATTYTSKDNVIEGEYSERK